jgi:putative nucleotidyltransferase with HDIG domain
VGAGLTLFIVLLFPTRQAFRYNLVEGEISRETIVAPISFTVQRSPEELETEREAARMSIPPVLVYSEGVDVRRTVLLDSLFTLFDDLREAAVGDSAAVQAVQRQAPGVAEESLIYLFAAELPGRTPERRSTLAEGRIDSLHSAVERVVSHYFSVGIVESKPRLREMSRGTITVISSDGESPLPLSIVVDMEQVRDSLGNMLREDPPGAEPRLVTLAYELSLYTLEPNLLLDEERTRLRREEAENGVPTSKAFVMAEEKIVDANTRVTEEVVEKLESLNRALAEVESERRLLPVLRTWLARAVLVVLILAIFIVWLRFHRPLLLRDNRTLISMAVLIAVELLLAWLLRESTVLSVYLVPVAVATMLLTILFDTGVGLVTAFTIGMLLGAVLGFDFPTTIIHTAAGAAGVFAVSRVRKRSHFYRALWVVPAIYLLAIASVELLRLSSLDELVRGSAYGVANGMMGVVITMGLLPIFESLFNFSTDITLLELSDLNHPLLRQLAMRAPGTYQHSLMIGELSAAAAEAIGANPLLTRVGAYFHDIGKMNKPEYFVENQQGYNPHDKLSPSMSALIVETHVKEGLELAEEHRLPAKIRDFIPEHHGTTVMNYFYLRALEEAREGEKVIEDDFRYPGPKPRSRETAIVMLADTIEAASRVIEEPTPRRIKLQVKELIENKFGDGQLDECPLTFRDLRLVREAFVTVLTSRFHQRIDYPNRDEALKKAAERGAEARQQPREGS